MSALSAAPAPGRRSRTAALVAARRSRTPATALVPLIILCGIALAPAPASAQDPLGEPLGDRECRCDRDFGAFEYIRAAPLAAFDRARIGVLLGEPEEVDGRTGILVEDVATGGPADRAGIRADDILLAIDGEALGEEPVVALLEALDDVEPGDTVAVTYHRDGRNLTARVVTDEMPHPAAAFMRPGARVRVIPQERISRMRNRIAEVAPRMRAFHIFAEGQPDLVEMNDQLGDYFGTSEGVLVAGIDADSPLALRAGDVILSIGGRQVDDPAHARSILASYRPDEELRLEVMRERRRVTVTGRRGDR